MSQLNASPVLDLLMSDEAEVSTSTVRIDTELVRKARIVCAHSPGRGSKQLKLVDYLDSIVRKKIEGDFARIIAEIKAAEDGSEPKKKRKESG